MPSVKLEETKVQAVLKEAITVLCKDSIDFIKDITVEGLLGITVDSDNVILVHMNEVIGPAQVLSGTKGSHDSESGEKVCSNCHSKQGSSGSDTSRKRSLEISDHSSQISETSKAEAGPPPLPARRRTKPVEPPLKRRNGGHSAKSISINEESSASNTSVMTVIVKSSSFIEKDATYQTLDPETTDPTNNRINDIFETPAASLLGTPLASSTATWDNPATSTQVSGIVPRFGKDLNFSNFSSPAALKPRSNNDDSPGSPSPAAETSSVNRQQASRRVIPRKRGQPGRGRKCLSLDGMLDAPTPAHEAKSFSLDTDDPRKNRFIKRNILLRRSSKASTRSAKSSNISGVSCEGNTCDYCGKTFASTAGMYYHLPIHTGRFKINCKTCGMGFMDTIKYRTHLQKQCCHSSGGSVDKKSDDGKENTT